MSGKSPVLGIFSALSHLVLLLIIAGIYISIVLIVIALVYSFYVTCTSH